MNLKLLAAASAAALFVAPAAMAQDAAAPAADPHAGHTMAPAAAPAPAAFTDAELVAFGRVMPQLREIAGDSGAAPTVEQQTAMAAAIQSAGLEIARFNEISVAVSADTALQARIGALMQAEVQAPADAAGAPAAAGAAD